MRRSLAKAFQKLAGRASWRRSAALPIGDRALVNAKQKRELGLCQIQTRPNGSYVDLFIHHGGTMENS